MRQSHPLFQFPINLTPFRAQACKSMLQTLMHKNVHTSLNIDHSTTKLVSFDNISEKFEKNVDTNSYATYEWTLKAALEARGASPF